MLDLDSCDVGLDHDEPDLHLGRLGWAPLQVPGVSQAAGRLPNRHLTPFVLGAVYEALEDPPTEPGLQDHLQTVGRRDGVVLGPPQSDPASPHVECVVGWAGHLELEADRLDQPRD